MPRWWGGMVTYLIGESCAMYFLGALDVVPSTRDPWDIGRFSASARFCCRQGCSIDHWSGTPAYGHRYCWATAGLRGPLNYPF